MGDVYLLETLMREHKADVERRAALYPLLHELQRSRGRGESLVARLRRSVVALLPIRRVERMGTR